MLIRAIAGGCRTGLGRVALPGGVTGLRLNSKVLESTRLMVAARMTATTPVNASGKTAAPDNHATHFKIERVFAACMVPLLPAALFIHNPAMDMCLAVAIALHVHWGLFAVVQDYARPIILGDTLAAAARASIYVMSTLMFLGLIHFNVYDCGITKAMEMLWTL